MKLKAYNFSEAGATLLDIGIKVGAAAAILLLDAISSAVTGGTLQLPYPALSVPILTLLVSQLDNYFVQYTAPKQ